MLVVKELRKTVENSDLWGQKSTTLGGKAPAMEVGKEARMMWFLT